MRLCFAKRPKGRSIFAAPVGALCEKSPPVRPNLVVAPLLGHRFATRYRSGDTQRARLGGVWGSRSRFKNASAIPLPPRRGANAIVIPKQGRIMRCPSARGRWVVRSRSSNDSPWASHPRARFGRALLPPKVALACPIGRGSRSKVVARPRPSASHHLRTLREDGGDAGDEVAQKRARHFRRKQVRPKSAALAFPPPAGVAPYPMREGQHRARPTGESARVSPRAAYAYGFGYFRAPPLVRPYGLA